MQTEILTVRQWTVRAAVLTGLWVCAVFSVLCLTGCGAGEHSDLPDSLIWESSMELQYAREFSVNIYRDGYQMISISDGTRLLMVPERNPVPDGLPEDITVLHAPVKNIYLAASAAMDMIRELDALSCIRLSGTEQDGWYIKEARDAMDRGEILYAGKYSSPDYERILSEDCGLAVENTMISHTPEVRETLLGLGIPVVTDYSSYEKEPLGRMEWIRFYGVLTGKDREAKEAFDAQKEAMDRAGSGEDTGKTVAFFYITANGTVNVRRPSDYIPKLIELAGGVYVIRDSAKEESRSSSMNMQMEEFYALAKDADYLIYNSAVGGTLDTVEELLGKSALLSDFKAVKEGHVWCTSENLYQRSMALGDFAADLRTMLTNTSPKQADTRYLFQLKQEKQNGDTMQDEKDKQDLK